MATVVAFFLVGALIVFGAMWEGYALMIVWGWFAVPTFGLPPLHLAQAIGLALVTGILTHQYTPNMTKEGTGLEQFLHLFKWVVVSPAVTLIGGFVVKRWL